MAQVFPLRLFNYTLEQRGDRWHIVCKWPGEGYEPFEMAPTFTHRVTASEIAAKASRGDEYTTSIPCVPYGAMVPRDPATVFAPGALKGTGPGKACSKCGREF